MCVGALLESDCEALVYALPNSLEGAAGHGHPARPARRAAAPAQGRQRHPARRGRGPLRGRRRRAVAVPRGRRDREGRPGRSGSDPEPLWYPLPRRGVRVVDGAALEKRCAKAPRVRIPPSPPSAARIRRRPPAERSPSGLGRRTGNAVWGNPSRVQIPPSPPLLPVPSRPLPGEKGGLLCFPGRARRGTSGALYLQSAPAGLNPLPRSPILTAAIRATSRTGSRAAATREPCQVRKEAALSDQRRVPRNGLV